MRINLKVPFSEKDSAKAAGARWDGQRKVWFVVGHEDLTPFTRWLNRPRGQQQKKNRVKVMSKPGVATPRTDHTLPDCGCANVPAWEDCQHSEAALEDAELEHIKSI
jgi:hypothetical protein